MRDWDNYDVVSFGTTKIPSDDIFLIDEAFVVQGSTSQNVCYCSLMLFLHTPGEKGGSVVAYGTRHI